MHVCTENKQMKNLNKSLGMNELGNICVHLHVLCVCMCMHACMCVYVVVCVKVRVRVIIQFKLCVLQCRSHTLFFRFNESE